MLSSTLSSLVLLAFLSPLGRSESLGKRCRCLPSDPCWPSDHEWSALNDTLDGNLATVTPIGSVCHEPNFDSELCAEANIMTFNSSWRSDHPGASQFPNWEAWPLRNESCYIGSSSKIPCRQGRVSLYSAAVESTEHIQTAINFASQHNLRLAVKNTGHDFVGRSLAPLSLQIFTHKMKEMSFARKFRPKGFNASEEELGPAVTVSAGVQLHDMYLFCHKNNVSVVAGHANSVGVAGGYIQGGGHSILGPWKGMAVDNVLQYTLVLANGTAVVANDYQNQELFWALRGGGGGTFGVVTSVTLRAHPNVPIIAASVHISRTDPDEVIWKLVQNVYEHVPAINQGFGASANMIVYPRVPPDASNISAGSRPSNISLGIYFINQSDPEIARQAVAPLEAAFQESDDNNTQSTLPGLKFNIQPFPSLGVFYNFTLSKPDSTGGLSRAGSRLISRDFHTSPAGSATIAKTLSRIPITMGAITSLFVAGGEVARNGDKVSTSINPAWRRTLSHTLLIGAWSPNSTDAEARAVQKQMTEEYVPMLKTLRLPDEPEMGSYLNEADADEPDFQRSFWGEENYARLYDIKKRWDPNGLFIVRKGVGSEDWDDDGLCRVGY